MSVYVIKEYKGIEGKDPLILILGIRCRSVFGLKSHQFHSGEKENGLPVSTEMGDWMLL